MGQKTQNLVNALNDSRSRTILVLVLIILLVFTLVGYVKIKRMVRPGAVGGSNVLGVPNISSVPGLGEPTREYAKLQEQQNADLAKEATQQGTAAIPTIVRTTYLDNGVGVGYDTQESQSCGVEALGKARSAGVTAAELRCRGCSLAALKAAGFTAADLLAAGFTAQDLKAAGFSAKELREAGYDAKELKSAGFGAADLATAGFSVGELLPAGYTAADMRNAGFSVADVGFAGTVEAKNSSACSVEQLRAARQTGGVAIDLKNTKCSSAALREAGFSVAELKNAGFPLSELRKAGYNAKDLKDVGFSAGELKAVGCSVGELRRAGFNAQAAKMVGFNANDLKKAGFTAGELQAAGVGPVELQSAGYSVGDLMRAGVDVRDASQIGCKADALKQAKDRGVSVDELRSNGCSDDALAAAGFDVGVSAVLPDNSGQNNSIALSGKPLASIAPMTGDNAVWQKQLDDIRKQQSQQLSAQEYQEKVKQLQQSMTGQATDLLTSWMPLPSQQYVAGEADKPAEQDGASQQPIAASSGEAAVSSTEAKGGATNINADVYKAGTILFAVLDTGINSDYEGSPVMATIVQAPFNGAKVLGNFKRTDKKVVLQFTLLNSPHLSNSISLNAVAIDPNTAKTALATHVDSHYMLRYGTLFASSFVSGIGQAIQNSGSSSSTSDNGTQQHFWPKLNTGQQAMVALGNVGQQYAGVLSPLFSTPPTVEVKSGSGIGMLLMTDLSVPKS